MPVGEPDNRDLVIAPIREKRLLSSLTLPIVNLRVDQTWDGDVDQLAPRATIRAENPFGARLLGTDQMCPAERCFDGSQSMIWG